MTGPACTRSDLTLGFPAGCRLPGTNPMRTAISTACQLAVGVAVDLRGLRPR
jgi:hypothetical protein